MDLLSLYPTLTELAGIEAKEDNDAPSLLPLLKNPKASDKEWPHVALTWLHTAGAVSVSDDDWRYIRYAKGDEELYNIKNDPYEWTNLAADPKHAAKLKELSAKAPKEFAPLAPVEKKKKK